MLGFVTGVLVASVLASATPPGKTILVLPIEPSGEVSRPLCHDLTAALATELGRHSTHTVTALSEIESALTVEQRRQALGCSSVACALEIAGALNSGEIVMGRLGRVGPNLLLAVSRVDSQTARVVTRVTRDVPASAVTRLLHEMPTIARELLGDDVTVAQAPERTSPLPLALRGLGGVGLLGAAVPGLAALVAGTVTTAIAIVDVTGGDWSNPQRRIHGVSWPVAVAGEVLGLGGLVLLLAALGLAALAAGVLASSWWVS